MAMNTTVKLWTFLESFDSEIAYTIARVIGVREAMNFVESLGNNDN